MRRAAKRDAAEPDIVDAFLAVGAQVERMNRPCDLAVRFRGVIRFLEVKTPGVRLDPRQKAQAAFLRLWEIPIVRTPLEALRAIGATRG